MTFISQIQVDQMCLCSLTYFAYYIIPGVLVLGVVQFDGMEIYAVIISFDSNAENCFYILTLHFQNEGKHHYNSKIVPKKQKENKYYASSSK